ncbi:serine hydrolase [Novosphingobium resinovorum]|nr:serine hydrolase [Novosphingobium resinovorum]
MVFRVLAGAGLLAPAVAVQAQDGGEAALRARIDQVVAIMQGKEQPSSAAVFDARFLDAVPPEKLHALASQLTTQGGALESWSAFRREKQGSATFTLHFANATAPARIELNPNPPGLVSGFRIFALAPSGDTAEQIAAQFAQLPGKAGFAVYRLGDGAPRLSHGRETATPFAVGSSFKLYVLAAIARQVKEGRRHWTDIVPVSGKSFPSGTIHTLPEGAPVTLHTLASLMISISDNTATDILVRLAGQEALAREVRLAGHADPAALTPMLTTAQLFALKRALTHGAPQTAERYVHASGAERQRLLDGLDLAAVAHADPGEVFGHGPVAIGEIEWFASPADLAGVMDDLRRLGSPEALDILAINPAMDDASARLWSYLGYKGGSEDGVMSMTWLLRDKAGRWSVVTGSWNDPNAPLDTERFETLMLRLAKVSAAQ